ncbi:hypothetical protein [Hymenobacter arcticus]
MSAASAQAQAVAPDFPAPGSPARSTAPTTSLDGARSRRQQQMSPEDAARDQQLQILEARTGNTSFAAERGGPSRQLDKSGGGFTVRKFKALPGQEHKKGESRQVVMGGRTTGKPLVHKHNRKKFLFF